MRDNFESFDEIFTLDVYQFKIILPISFCQSPNDLKNNDKRIKSRRQDGKQSFKLTNKIQSEVDTINKSVRKPNKRRNSLRFLKD